jgi:hypothetical protein
MFVMVALMLVGLLISSWAPERDLTRASNAEETSPILEEVQNRGFLRCGVAPMDAGGFRYLGPGGKFEGFDIDFCKALTAAIFRRDTQIEYVVPEDWPARFTLLQDGNADVVFAVATVTGFRDSMLHVDFPAIYYYEVTSFEGEQITDALGPAVAHGDQKWADIVRWVIYSMITAEELGVDSRNVHRMAANPPNARVANLLGKDGNLGVDLGLPNDFMVNVIFRVGNYAEIYDRHEAAGLDPRTGGLNSLWTEGGLLYAPSRP